MMTKRRRKGGGGREEEEGRRRRRRRRRKIRRRRKEDCAPPNFCYALNFIFHNWLVVTGGLILLPHHKIKGFYHWKFFG
jgi:hypothetical protein